jgi:hypothetical protein
MVVRGGSRIVILEPVLRGFENSPALYIYIYIYIYICTRRFRPKVGKSHFKSTEPTFVTKWPIFDLVFFLRLNLINFQNRKVT